MELSLEEFLGSVSNKKTRRAYKFGIKKFCDWFGKSPREILEMRKSDLTQKDGENLIEYRNRASRFQKEIEKFHSSLLEQGAATNSARTISLGIRQLFRYYEMPVRTRNGSKLNKTVQTTRSFPLRIEHVRTMFKVTDIRERAILSMATDLGLRISDFIKIKKEDLPALDQEAPISFNVMTGKEEVVAEGFLSSETVEVLKSYMRTLKKDNPFLFPSNKKRHISDQWLGKLLQKLAEKAQINTNGKSLTFHCFRKMFLSASIDSGIGMIAGKKLCGKSIPISDNTYLTMVKLRKKFIELKEFLTIHPEVKPSNHETTENLKKAISKLQEDLTQQKAITETVSESNLSIKKELEERDKNIRRMNWRLKDVRNQHLAIKEELELRKYESETFKTALNYVVIHTGDLMKEIAKLRKKGDLEGSSKVKKAKSEKA